MEYLEINIEKIKAKFLRFAEVECKTVSLMYYKLSVEIAEDENLLKLASYCKQGQPIPNLFFAAVHYLLFKDPSQPLALYYPSITENFRKELPFDLFKAFCLKFSQQIKTIEQTKIVQTNALNRCAYLMPFLSSLFDGQKINLIDIGTSAGLTLNMDKYEYHFSGVYSTGNSPVKIKSEIRSGELPSFNKPIHIHKKIGIDQNPLDLKVDENALWLRALVWADSMDRIKKMDAAILIAQQENIEFIKANSLIEFQEIISAQDKNCPLVVYHTHALYQFSKEDRSGFWDMLDGVGSKRDLCYLAVEHSSVFRSDYEIDGILFEFTQYKKGVKKSKIVAETNGHANWIKWK